MKLRPEAQPVASFSLLFPTQQEAFEWVVVLIADASNQIDSEPTASGGWLDRRRTSRTAQISGPRGTGKTTVMATVARAVEQASLPGTPTAISEHLSDLSRRIVWLEPLDMESIP